MFRQATARTPAPQAAGLGLHIVLRFVDELGGKIHVTSALGESSSSPSACRSAPAPRRDIGVCDLGIGAVPLAGTGGSLDIGWIRTTWCGWTTPVRSSAAGFWASST
jgi:signal transduction histidine kinase